MRFKAVFFDLDGTLANSLEDLAVGVNHVLETNGFPKHDVSEFKYFAGNGIPVMIRRALPKGTDEKTTEKLKNEFLEYYSKHYCDNTRAYDGLVDVAEHLKNAGMKIAVVTNKAQNMAELVVKKLFGDTFDLVIGMKPDVPAKPDPTAVLSAMRALNIDPCDCAFVGDTSVDICTGVNSGAFPVGVLWGFRTRQELVEAGAEEIAETALELENILIG